MAWWSVARSARVRTPRSSTRCWTLASSLSPRAATGPLRIPIAQATTDGLDGCHGSLMRSWFARCRARAFARHCSVRSLFRLPRDRAVPLAQLACTDAGALSHFRARRDARAGRRRGRGRVSVAWDLSASRGAGYAGRRRGFGLPLAASWCIGHRHASTPTPQGQSLP